MFKFYSQNKMSSVVVSLSSNMNILTFLISYFLCMQAGLELQHHLRPFSHTYISSSRLNIKLTKLAYTQGLFIIEIRMPKHNVP
jgi:hypothetical protein